MSYVYNVLLLTEVDEWDDNFKCPLIENEVNTYLTEHGYGVMNQLDDKVGGNKCFEVSLYGAAINYLDLADFMEFLVTLPWENPREAALIYKKQEEPPVLVTISDLATRFSRQPE